MPRRGWISWLSALALLGVAGCADNPMVLQGRLSQSEQQQQVPGAAERAARGPGQGHGSGQSGPRVASGPVAAAGARGRGPVVRPARAASRADRPVGPGQADKQNYEQKTQALSASLHRQTGVSISPNNSFLQTLPAIHQPDVYVRRDGDVIRVELPAQSPLRAGRVAAAARGGQSHCRRRRRTPPQLSRSDHRRRGPHGQRSGRGRAMAKQPRVVRSPRRWPSTRC